ncbi:MAG: hypothetical protein KAJ19_03440 [Gammaproteobacteria bacterium]|nr:hypothetical protein [Gammaproteobacteria bacterium]
MAVSKITFKERGPGVQTDSYDYKQEFQGALKRTESLGIDVPPADHYAACYRSDKNINRLVAGLSEVYGSISPRKFLGQCLNIHHQLKPLVDDCFKVKSYYTVGYVRRAGQDMFKITEADIAELLTSGMQGTTLNYHAWLTLPSMEIIDLTLPTVSAVIKNNSNDLGGIIANNPNHLNEKLKLKFKPVIVGQDFLNKIGALEKFEPMLICDVKK